MGLSNYLPTSAIARPGVCTSSTRPASPYDGQVIWETDTDKTLVWNGSAWVYLSTSTANPVGLELIKTQTIGSGVASVTVSDAFNSTFDNYKIVVFGGTLSIANNVGIALGSSTTAYYHGGSVFNYSNGGQTTVSGSNEGTFSRAGIGNTNGMSLEVDVFGPFLTSRTTFTCRYIFMSIAGYSGMMLGYHDVSASYTAFTFTPAGGTFTGGTINVYGYKK